MRRSGSASSNTRPRNGTSTRPDERVKLPVPIIATYRLQLHPGFGFDAVFDILPYLRALGVSHLYLSPFLQAVPGSTHGYDVVDPTRVNDELGGPAGFERLRQQALALGLGLVIDVVPNHLA